MSLANKYRPKSFNDVCEQHLVVDMIQNLCNQDTLSNRNFLLSGPAGCGKAQPLYSKLLTPNGFIKMQDVKIGTELYTAKGNIGKVIGIYPQGVRPIYEITLSDRTKIRVSDEHLNVIYRYNYNTQNREDFVLTTKELLEFKKSSKYKLRIDIPSIDFKDNSNLVMNPYLLGVLLGDGALSNGNLKFSNTEPDVIRKVDSILRHDYAMYLKPITTRPQDFYIAKLPDSIRGELRHILDELDIRTKSVNKHIPIQYLLASKKQRLELLRGLIDSDGNVSPHGDISFSTSSKQLSEDFAFLCRSLGIRDTIGTKVSKYRTKHSEEYVYTNNTHYRHYLKVPSDIKIFTSEKHSKKYTTKMYEPMRNIVSIEYIADEKCQCIMIDHADHTYISDDFIPTHNTTLGRLIANTLNDGNTSNIFEIDSAAHASADGMRELMNQAKSYPIGSKYKCFICDECHAISPTGWSIALKTLEESPAKSVFIFCTTNPEKIPDTIISRVQTFKLSKISLEGITNRLKYVLDNEIAEGNKLTYDADAVSFIAKLANGGMRDALTLLDKSIAYNPNVTSDNVTTALNLPNYDDYFILLNAYAKHDNGLIISIIDKIYNSGINFVTWFENFHAFVMNVVKYIYTQDINLTLIPISYKCKMDNYTPTHAIVCLKLSNILVKLIHELKSTQHLQEMALAYLCSPTK